MRRADIKKNYAEKAKRREKKTKQNNIHIWHN